MAFPIYEPLVGLTLTATTTAQSLLSLIEAAQTSVGTSPTGQNTITSNAPIKCRWMTISVPTGAANDLLLGAGPTNSQGNVNPGKLTTANYGLSIAAGGGEDFVGFRDEDFNLSHLWVIASAGTVNFNVLIYRG